MKKPFLRKGQKLRITNLHNVDWYEMGLTMEEYNEGQKEDGMTMVIIMQHRRVFSQSTGIVCKVY